ncbi:MAG: tRNA (N(6)-L-threonylcarbamoyladenosine(37)-C(2))-methylthiotransferase MtaB [Erysipelotrichaceae bacterium]
MLKFKVVTLGCKVNSYEAQSVHQSLIDEGYTESLEAADIYVVFTCAVTNVAESKTRKKINQLSRENPDAILCVVGCYVQMNPQQLAQQDHIHILIGSNHKSQIVEAIHQYQQTKQKIYYVDDQLVKPKYETMNIQHFNHQTRAYLKIQDGCNQFCSYCIIPYARGAERSLKLEEVLMNANKLVETGHKEIVLAGIHTGRYKDENNHHLDDLVHQLIKIDGLQRIRFSSIEITEISDVLIDLMKNNPKIARHLHIPLQSGCDEILAKMNRPYTINEFKKRVNYIREMIPDISISTDLIVGFPNETDDSFEKTVQTLNDVAFSFIHVFPYAKKTGTVAYDMLNHVDEQIKKQRGKICGELSKNSYASYQASMIGKTVNVLIEKSGTTSFGHTSEYVPIYINRFLAANQLIEIKVIGVDEKGLRGE